MDSRRKRIVPFAVAALVLFLICLAMVRLPDAYASRLERNRPFNSSQAGWAYRLLAFAAIGQAAYGGFAILQVEKIRQARLKDPRLADMPAEDVVRSVARNAAGMTLLTLVYGIASFYVTGQRGGFWLFPLVAVAQGAWYFRQVGQIAKWMDFQPEVEPDKRKRAPVWRREPPDYSPPLGR